MPNKHIRAGYWRTIAAQNIDPRSYASWVYTFIIYSTIIFHNILTKSELVLANNAPDEMFVDVSFVRC